MKLANTRRQEMFRDPKYNENNDLEVRNKVQPRTRTAKTARGKRLLRAAEVENNLVQDKSGRLEIIGADVEALYTLDIYPLYRTFLFLLLVCGETVITTIV